MRRRKKTTEEKAQRRQEIMKHREECRKRCQIKLDIYQKAVYGEDPDSDDIMRAAHQVGLCSSEELEDYFETKRKYEDQT